MRITKKISVVLFSVLMLLFSGNLMADVPDPHQEEAKKFDTGSFILGHIGDSYGWHVLTWGHTHVTLPLPIIVRGEQSGWHVFMSSKLEHGHASYKGFHIAHEGEFKGKLVETLGEKVVDELVDGKVIGQKVVEQTIRPLDLSITKNVFALLVSILILILIFRSVANSYKKNQGHAPKGLQSALEPLIIFIRDDLAKPAIGEKKYKKYLPFLLTVFFFIFLNNLMGLIPILPGGANLTGNIAITMVLALFTFVITTLSANKNYWIHIFNTPGVPWWLKLPVPLMPIVEFSGIFIKPFVLMVRLFANITAGHIIALGFYSLIFIFGNQNIYAGYGVSVVSIAFTVFMSMLELLVAFIQAYVFTLLSALYFGMAIEEHH